MKPKQRRSKQFTNNKAFKFTLVVRSGLSDSADVYGDALLPGGIKWERSDVYEGLKREIPTAAVYNLTTGSINCFVLGHNPDVTKPLTNEEKKEFYKGWTLVNGEQNTDLRTIVEFNETCFMPICYVCDLPERCIHNIKPFKDDMQNTFFACDRCGKTLDEI